MQLIVSAILLSVIIAVNQHTTTNNALFDNNEIQRQLIPLSPPFSDGRTKLDYSPMIGGASDSALTPSFGPLAS